MLHVPIHQPVQKRQTSNKFFCIKVPPNHSKCSLAGGGNLEAIQHLLDLCILVQMKGSTGMYRLIKLPCAPVVFHGFPRSLNVTWLSLSQATKFDINESVMNLDQQMHIQPLYTLHVAPIQWNLKWQSSGRLPNSMISLYESIPKTCCMLTLPILHRQ